MWKNINGRLIHTKDETREEFKTTISKELLNSLRASAEQSDTYINYLLETGIQRVLDDNYVQYNKTLRPKDRIQYLTTYDSKLLKQLKEFASAHKLYVNDVIEYSAKYIDPEKAKKKDHRGRIEKV